MIERLNEDLKTNLSLKRYEHTVRVKEMACELAGIHGEDIGRASVAALCHDYAKCLDPKTYLELAERLEVELDEYMQADLGLAHGLIGAAMVSDEYGIGDEEVLLAIANHTCGRAGMTRLEKIVYLADYIEYGRSFPGVERIRKAALEDLDQGMRLALGSTIAHVKSRHKTVHPNSLEALNFYSCEMG